LLILSHVRSRTVSGPAEPVPPARQSRCAPARQSYLPRRAGVERTPIVSGRTASTAAAYHPVPGM